MTNLKMKPGVRYGNQIPQIHIHNPEAKSYYDLPVVSGAIARWISEPFPWQELVYRDAFAISEDGNSFGNKVVCTSIPRRNGKTEIQLGIMAVSAILFSAKTIYLPSDADLAQETYDRFMEFATDPKNPLSAYFPGLQKKQKSHEHVIRAFDPTTGEKLGSLKFRTRAGRGGRGGYYDVVILDEAQDLTEKEYQRYGPTNAAKKKEDKGKKKRDVGLTILFGTPPPLDTKTEAVASGMMFKQVRQDLINQIDIPWHSRVSNRGTVWIEWGADRIHDRADRDAWYDYNPSMGWLGGFEDHFENILLSPEAFSVEHLGYWTKQVKDRAIEIGSFNKLGQPKADLMPTLRNLPFAIGVKSDYADRRVYVGLAFQKPDEEVAYRQMAVFSTDNPAWEQRLEELIVDLAKRAICQSVMVDGALATTAVQAALIRNKMWDAKKSKIAQGKVVMASPKDMANSCSTLLNAISTRRFTYAHEELPLHAAAADAAKRKIGEAGFGFRALTEGTDIVPLEVAALATYGIQQHGKRRSGDIDLDGRRIQKGLGGLS